MILTESNAAVRFTILRLYPPLSALFKGGGPADRLVVGSKTHKMQEFLPSVKPLQNQRKRIDGMRRVHCNLFCQRQLASFGV